MGLTISIKNFLASPANATIDQCVNAYYYIVTHSIFDFLSKETTDEFPKYDLSAHNVSDYEQYKGCHKTYHGALEFFISSGRMSARVLSP